MARSEPKKKVKIAAKKGRRKGDLAAMRPPGELVIITGMSGSGKASVLKAFEDLGYYCVDNLPVELIPNFAELVGQSSEISRTALVVDVREGSQLESLPAIVNSVKKTGRCVIVHEATRTSGFGAELAALVQEHCFYHLEAPIERVTGWDTPYPHALEWAYFPGPARVGAALQRAMEA